MIWQLEYLENVKKEDIPALPATMRERIKKAIDTRLTTEPESYGKPLRHDLSGYWSLRTGDYRILYKIDKTKNLVTIIHIDHRKNVYE